MLLSESPRKPFINSVIRLLVTVTTPFLPELLVLDARAPNVFVPPFTFEAQVRCLQNPVFRGHHVEHSLKPTVCRDRAAKSPG